MRKLGSVLTALALIAALLTGTGVSAFAEEVSLGEPVYTGDDSDYFGVYRSANRLEMYENGKEYMCDWEMNVLSDGYDMITDYYGWLEITDGDLKGIMDRDGSVIVPVEYGEIDIEGNFAALCTLEEADESDHDVTVFSGGDTAYMKYASVQIVDLRTGEVKLEMTRSEFAYMLLESGILIITDGEYNARYFDDDFNEMTYDEAAETVEEANGYSVIYDYRTELFGLEGIGGNTLKIDAAYDEFLGEYSTGAYCADGYFCARCGNELYFINENGEITAQFGNVDPEQTVIFYGSCAIGWDDNWNDRDVYNAEGGYFEIDPGMYPHCIAYFTDAGVYLIAQTEDSDRYYLLDTHGNILADGSMISVTSDGHVVVDDHDTDTYCVYAPLGEA